MLDLPDKYIERALEMAGLSDEWSVEQLKAWKRGLYGTCHGHLNAFFESILAHARTLQEQDAQGQGEPVAVDQRHRDAAAAQTIWSNEQRKDVLAGKLDKNPNVVAFASFEASLSTKPQQQPQADWLTQEAREVSDETIELVLQVYRGGLVDVPDGNNSRGYTTMYRPKEAMRAALEKLREAGHG